MVDPKPQAKLDINNQLDPSWVLLQAGVDTSEKEQNMVTSVSDVTSMLANFACKNVKKGDDILQDDAAAVHDADGGPGDVQKASTAYQTAQTQVSNTNQQMNNVVDAANSSLKALTQQIAEVLQFAGIASDLKQSLSGLLTGMSS